MKHDDDLKGLDDYLTQTPPDDDDCTDECTFENPCAKCAEIDSQNIKVAVAEVYNEPIYECFSCEKKLTQDDVFVEVDASDKDPVTRCGECGRRVPRIVDMSKPLEAPTEIDYTDKGIPY